MEEVTGWHGNGSLLGLRLRVEMIMGRSGGQCPLYRGSKSFEVVGVGGEVAGAAGEDADEVTCYV